MEITDVVYGKFTLTQDVAAIVETPQFQRLKSIKQLGLLRIDDKLEHEHHRYAHCLGTYHAACLMLDALEKNTDWLRDNNNKIPRVYRKAVQIAALLHDVAHGPFSHTWEHVVQDYVHEEEAFPCINHIFEQIDKDFFPELRENDNFGIELVKALIDGKMENFRLIKKLPDQFKFIFEIVSNKRSKLDVDKWDYLKRDFYYLNYLYKPNMDFDDVFLKARVSSCGLHVEHRYEDFDKICKLFQARYDFHVHCYSLPPFSLSDFILNLAVQEIQPKINNRLVTDIKAKNMFEFLQLTDGNVLKSLENSVFYKFLQFDTKFVKVENIVEETTHAPVVIKSVAKYMPKMERISFYGDIKNQSEFHDQTVLVKKVYRCYCDQSNQTVYYTIEHL